MRRMLFTTVALTAALAAAPGCQNNKPRINTPPTIETSKKVDTMGDSERRLQIVPKKIEAKSDTAEAKSKLELEPPPEIKMKIIPPDLKPTPHKPIKQIG